MAIISPWKYYYAAKDALQMVEAYFVFNNNEDSTYKDFEDIYAALKHIGMELGKRSDVNES